MVKDRKGKGGGGGGNSKKLNFKDGDIAVKMVVSPSAASKIIGPKGSFVAELRETFGVGVCILNPEDAFPGLGQQMAILAGARDSINEALLIVAEKIATDEGSPTKGSETLMTLVLSQAAVTKIIGKGGSTISELRAESGCQFAAVPDVYMGEQLLHITGSPETLPAAVTLLTPYIELAGDSTDLALQNYNSGGGRKGKHASFEWGKGDPKGGGGGGKAYEPPGSVAPYGGKGKTDSKGKSSGGPIGAGADHGKGSKSDGKHKGKGGKVDDYSDSRGGGKAHAKASGKVASHSAISEPPFKRARHQEEILDGPQAACHDPLVLDSESTIAFYIPSDAIGKVLGKSGAIAAEIRQSSGCTLKIEPSGEEATVTLTGALSGVHAAHCMVIARVMSEI
eukprot:TRINITY_DN101925_c0_g1_i1.p1 TRINITY_DN101925_c0_g1~~TRINITY_DN101925_c0_g1_i1.p1  ORF type:complete len:412 (-),score=95.86 TRINITY_DN101925_c0_g1_i1:194-1378(-)